jgi:DNA-binding MarR family transcriptional regulator
MLCLTIVAQNNDTRGPVDNLTIQNFRKNLRRLQRKLFGQLEGDAICCGVTMAQCHVLLAIEEKGLTTVTELAAELELDKSTLSRTVDSLVGDGLVRRETNAGNRRSQHISLTPQGEEATAGINEQWNSYFLSLFAQIPKTKHEAVLEGISLLSGVILCPEECCREKGGGGVQEEKEIEKKRVRGEVK